MISEDVYYDVIKMKTAALFESCAGIGAMSAGASQEEVEKAKRPIICVGGGVHLSGATSELVRFAELNPRGP